MPRDAKVDPGASPIDSERLMRLLGYNLSRAEQKMRKVFNLRMGRLQLRPVEYSVLVLIAGNPRINQRQLGDSLDVSAPNLAVLLDRLADRKLVRRVRGSEDRRTQHLHLTAAGKKLVAEAEKVVLAMEGDVLSIFTAGERTLLSELLQRLARVRLARP